MFLRQKLRDRFRERVERITPISTKDLAASTIVFSPHSDDETLGCGGTIIRKLEVGGQVKIVFMTDGSFSHHRFIPEDELIELRQKEALAATEALGLAAPDVMFLDFRDGTLQQSSHMAIAIKVMQETIKTYQPTIIYEVDDGDRSAYERKYRELAAFFESLDYQVTQAENSYETIDWYVGHAIATPVLK